MSFNSKLQRSADQNSQLSEALKQWNNLVFMFIIWILMHLVSLFS